MEYSDELAAQIRAKHPEINDQTEKTWKFRGKIPDRYADDNFAFRKKVSANSLTAVVGLKQDRLAQVLGNDKFYRDRIGELAGLTKNQMMEFVKGRMNLTEAERLSLTKEVQLLRKAIKDALGEQTDTLTTIIRQKAIFRVAQDSRLKKVTVFGEVTGRRLNPASIKRDNSTWDKFSRDQYQAMADALYLLLLESTL